MTKILEEAETVSVANFCPNTGFGPHFPLFFLFKAYYTNASDFYL